MVEFYRGFLENQKLYWEGAAFEKLQDLPFRTFRTGSLDLALCNCEVSFQQTAVECPDTELNQHHLNHLHP